MSTVVKAKRKRSPRGNWLVVKMLNGEISWCTWVQTWAGVQASKRNKQKYIDFCQRLEDEKARRSHHNKEPRNVGRVFVLDIERMLDFAITEGGNEINDLHKLWERS